MVIMMMMVDCSGGERSKLFSVKNSLKVIRLAAFNGGRDNDEALGPQIEKLSVAVGAINLEPCPNI